MPNYSPTTNPGETRRRTRFIGIRTPLGATPVIEVLEQDVVRLIDGETVLKDLGNCPVAAFDPSESFPVRDPDTDTETGDTATVGEAFALVYSWVRQQQLNRDAAS
jgi:hypothetical protein